MPNRLSQTSLLLATRFYGILDTGYVPNGQWVETFDALRLGGAGIIQVRAKKENAAERQALLERVLARASELEEVERPFIVINDDIDLCLKHANVGLHIGQDDTPPAEARERLGPQRLLGLSTHSIIQAQAAMDLPQGILDYFAVGPVFATQTKPDYRPVGLELVRWTAAQKPELPFFCIGGINRSNAAHVAQAGARRIVTVSDVLLDADTARAVRETLDALAAGGGE